MAVDKLVDSTQLDADLLSVANAIRAKSGGSGSLAFPAGFVSEIGSISGGGGGGSANFAYGTYTPTARRLTMSFDVGFTGVTGVAITPTSETPLKSGGLTTGGGVMTTNKYYKVQTSRSNSAGASWNNVNAVASTQGISQSGTTVTVTHTATQGYFEAIEYSWFAWKEETT